jgi:hypothetical protein
LRQDGTPYLPACALLLAMLMLPLAAAAIEARELLLTVQGAYVHPLSPEDDYESYSGDGFHASLEKVLDNQNTLGIMINDAVFNSSTKLSTDSITVDAIGRHFWQPYAWLNPYAMLGIGGNFFEPAMTNPFGDVFHMQAALGNLFVLNSYWALDYAVAYHLLAPITAPYAYAEFRIGLSYRFGGQPRVNYNKPPDHIAIQVETLPSENVDRIVGHFDYEVKLGDSLYSIAQAKLGNAQLWPLLADENAATVKDPQWIFPKEHIEIKHHYPEDKKKAAIFRAWLVKDQAPKGLSPTAAEQN